MFSYALIHRIYIYVYTLISTYDKSILCCVLSLSLGSAKYFADPSELGKMYYLAIDIKAT